jgi:hypothetical protein
VAATVPPDVRAPQGSPASPATEPPVASSTPAPPAPVEPTAARAQTEPPQSPPDTAPTVSVAPPAPPVAPNPAAPEPAAPVEPAAPPRRPRGPPVSPRAVVADARRKEAREDRRRAWKRDPLAEVCANWQRPGPDDVPACIFCDDAYRGVVHNSGKGPDAFFYCCTCDKHFTRREADFFAGRRGVLT